MVSAHLYPEDIDAVITQITGAPPHLGVAFYLTDILVTISEKIPAPGYRKLLFRLFPLKDNVTSGKDIILELYKRIVQTAFDKYQVVKSSTLAATLVDHPEWAPLLWEQIPPPVLFPLAISKEALLEPRLAQLRIHIPSRLPLSEYTQDPDFIPAFVSLYRHLERILGQLSPLHRAKLCRRHMAETSYMGLEISLEAAILTLLQIRSETPSYPDLIPDTNLALLLWHRITPLTNEDVDTVVADTYAGLGFYSLQVRFDRVRVKLLNRGPNHLPASVRAYLRELLRPLWRSLVDGLRIRSVADLEALVPANSKICRATTYRTPPVASFTRVGQCRSAGTSLFSAVRETLFTLTPSDEPTELDIDLAISSDPGLRNLLGARVPLVNILQTEEELLSSPKRLWLSRLIGPHLIPYLDLLLNFTKHFEILFKGVDDAAITEWIQLNLAGKFSAQLALPPRECVVCLLLGVFIGGALHYVGQWDEIALEKIEYRHWVASVGQNPYFDLKPYLKITKFE